MDKETVIRVLVRVVAIVNSIHPSIRPGILTQVYSSTADPMVIVDR